MMEVVQINSNIKLHYIPMPKLKTTSVGVYIHRPLDKTEASYNAMLPMVLSCGSRLYPSREAIADCLDNLYGAVLGNTVVKRGEDHIIYFDAETISDRYTPNGEKLMKRLLELMMSVIFDPEVSDNGFREDELAREKKNAINNIDSYINDKRSYASLRCKQETARGTAYSIMSLGEKEIIAEITAKGLYDYYQSMITSSVIDIYICGDTDFDEAENTVRKAVSHMKFSEAKLPTTEILSRKSGTVNSVTEHMNVAQGKLAMGYITNVKPTDPDSYALAVFNSVFGAGAHSKLFNNVREKLSLAYYASSASEKTKGMIIVNAGIEFENFEKARDEISVQLEEIRNGNISEHEFEASIKAILNICNSYYDDQRAMASFYMMQRVTDTGVTLEEYIENIKKVTVTEVAEVAKKLQLDTVYFLAGEDESNA